MATIKVAPALGSSNAPRSIAPQKGRVRATQSMDAAGELSLRLLERNGEAMPANVVRLNPLPVAARVERSPEMLLALVAFLNLPESNREDARSDLWAMAHGTRDPHALALLELLRAHR